MASASAMSSNTANRSASLSVVDINSFGSDDDVSVKVFRCLGGVLLKCVHIPMLTKEGNDVISQDIIPIVNGIHSTTADMECCSVMITDPAPHIDTPSTPSIRQDKAVIVIPFSTPTPHSQIPRQTLSIYLLRSLAIKFYHFRKQLVFMESF